MKSQNSMNPLQRARVAVRKFIVHTEIESYESAKLGKPDGTIVVTGRPRRVWITKGDNTYTEAINEANVPHNVRLPLKVRLEHNTYVVKGVDASATQALVNLPGNPYGVQPHPFTTHIDVPSSYTGAAGKPVEVNSNEDGLIFGAYPVDSVNGQVGTVVLDADDISDAATANKFTDAADIAKLAGIEAAADVTDIANVGAAIVAASTDDTIDDADLFPRTTGGTLVKTAWSNIKTVLLTYFSTLFAVLAGTAGGQTLRGGTGSGDNLILESTSHATKGQLIVEAGTEVNIGNDPLNTDQFNISGPSAAMAFTRYNVSFGPAIALRSSRTSSLGTHVILLANGEIGRVDYRASDGAAFRNAAQIVALVDGTPGASDMPGRIEFRVTPVGSVTPVMALVIKQDKRIGNVASPQGQLHLHDGTGGGLDVSKTGIVGSAQVIIPNAAGDVVAGVFITGTITNAVPQTIFINQGVLNGANADITADGGTNTLRFSVNANGELSVIRQAGSSTWACALRCVWK